MVSRICFWTKEWTRFRAIRPINAAYFAHLFFLLTVGRDLLAGLSVVTNSKNAMLVHAFRSTNLLSRRDCKVLKQAYFPAPILACTDEKSWRLFGHPFGAPDPPLSSLIQMPDQFALASTPQNYIPLENGQRLVCLGDVHGDYQALVDFLQLAGVLEFRFEEQHHYYPRGDRQHSALPNRAIPMWTGNNTILVQCGDVLDRGSEELACYQLLAELSHQAESQGGKVICLLGNHEALNAVGLFHYATTDAEYENVVGKLVDEQLNEYFKEHPSTTTRAHLFQHQQQHNQNTPLASWRVQYVGNQPARWATYEPNGLLARSLMANMKVAIQVGRTVCVHAGLTAEHLLENGGIAGLNEQTKSFLLGDTLRGRIAYNNHGYYASVMQPFIDAERRQSTYINSIPKFLGGGIGSSSPVWMRDYSSPADSPPRNSMALSMIERALEQVGDCDRMVMGHTVQSKINAALDGKAWRVDVGASRGVIAGTPEVLEVMNVDGTEVVSVLTKSGKIAGSQRHVMAMAQFL